MSTCGCRSRSDATRARPSRSSSPTCPGLRSVRPPEEEEVAVPGSARDDAGDLRERAVSLALVLEAVVENGHAVLGRAMDTPDHGPGGRKSWVTRGIPG